MSESIDPAPYVTAPRLTVRSGLSLAKMLLAVVPDGAGPGVHAGAQALRDAALDLEAKWKANESAPKATDVRPLDTQLDRMWGVLERSLDRYTVLPSGDEDRSRAAQLDEALFYDGLGFLKLRYVEQHAESQRRIDRIAEEGLREDLDRLVGPKFVEALHEAHQAYGDALGITAPSEPRPSLESLLEPLRAVGRAVVGHAVQLLAFGADPTQVEAARRALAPIDAFRAAARRTKGSDEDDEAPLPEGAPPPDAAMPPLPEE